MVPILRFLFELLEGIFSGILEAGFDLLSALFVKKRKTELDASFMENPSELVLPGNRGFTVNGELFLSIENSLMNQITYGGSGAGKTSNILLPQVLNSLGYASMVINDPSGEIAKVVIPVARSRGVHTQIINYERYEISEQYNPLARIKTVGDAQKVSNMFLSGHESKSSDPFWRTSASNILSVCFRLLVFHSPKEVCTVHNALHILNEMSCGDTVDRLFARVKNDEPLVAAYRSFIANDRKLANSILATAKSALTLFQDDSVVHVTAGDTLDFASFRRKPTILFINNNIANTRHYASLTGILLQQFFNALMEEIPSSPATLPIYFNIDESASVTYDGLPIIAANCRKYLFSLALFYQSYHQCVDHFSASQAKSVEANCWTRILLPGTPIDIASRIQEELGVFEYETDDKIRRTRPLMNSSEIKECPDALVFCGRHRAMRLALKPYHRSRLRKLLHHTPFEPERRVITGTPPLIQFV